MRTRLFFLFRPLIRWGRVPDGFKGPDTPIEFHQVQLDEGTRLNEWIFKKNQILVTTSTLWHLTPFTTFIYSHWLSVFRWSWTLFGPDFHSISVSSFTQMGRRLKLQSRSLHCRKQRSYEIFYSFLNVVDQLCWEFDPEQKICGQGRFSLRSWNTGKS